MTTPPAGLDATSSNGPDGESLRILSRSPHPYRLSSYRESHAAYSEEAPRKRRSKINSAGGSSESGTEADDETDRQGTIKALPPPQLRERKGLKDGEIDPDTLLSPSQLDPDGRPLDGHQSQQEHLTRKEERDLLFKRRINEFARRCCELGLMIFVTAAVLCGPGVLSVARQWWFELCSHVVIMAILILAYPVRLSLLDTQTTVTKPWQRFRVPVSFDPATVLYPPLLPVLVALTILPVDRATTLLPNIILGLASLPQRLFPRYSRLGGFNTLHWLVSILPLVLAPRTPSKWSETAGAVQSLDVSMETLVSLYPLHHSLLAPLHYLTTSSLLISELHLLSAALINLLLFAASPQAVILKACLWIGGATLFPLMERVLHWNVALARVPKWKLRQPGHPDAERRSLIDAVAEIINMQRATRALQGHVHHDSDADEDHSMSTQLSSQGALSALTAARALLDLDQNVVASAEENAADTRVEPSKGRRYTLPASTMSPESAMKDGKKKAKKRSSHVPWTLKLTIQQATVRKTAYAAYTYLIIAILVLGPVRYYVGRRALFGREPLSWAISYLFGQFEWVRHLITTLGLGSWIPYPVRAQGLNTLFGLQLLPLDMPAMRLSLGAATIRLLITAYWAIVLAIGLGSVFTLTPYVEVDTRRKIFHGVMVAMFMPALFIDPCFCALAVGLVLAIFLLLEVIRAAQIWPLGTAIGRFIAPYVDGRDLRGPVVVSHLFLLIGCAVPLWFSLAGIERQDDGGEDVWRSWETKGQVREVAMLAGVICVGMGDAAASLIGRRYGRRKWPWVGGKSFEGSTAFAVAVTGGLVLSKIWLHIGGWQDAAPVQFGIWSMAFWLIRAGVCACGASFMEAVLTGANDNVVVPVALWLLIKGMRL